MKNFEKVKFDFMPQKRVAFKKAQEGVALLEALIAILIFSFGVLGIVGLQGAMVKGTTQAKSRTDASFIAQRRVAMIWADPDPATISNFSEVDTPVTELPAGLRTTAVTLAGTKNKDADVVVTVRWTVPGEPQHTYSTNAHIYGAAD